MPVMEVIEAQISSSCGPTITSITSRIGLHAIGRSPRQLTQISRSGAARMATLATRVAARSGGYLKPVSEKRWSEASFTS